MHVCRVPCVKSCQARRAHGAGDGLVAQEAWRLAAAHHRTPLRGIPDHRPERASPAELRTAGIVVIILIARTNYLVDWAASSSEIPAFFVPSAEC